MAAAAGAGWNGRRIGLSILLLGAVGVAAAALAGPESWKLALQDFYYDWLSPRRSGGAFDQEVVAELNPVDEPPRLRKVPTSPDEIDGIPVDIPDPNDPIRPGVENRLPDDLPALQPPDAPRLMAETPRRTALVPRAAVRADGPTESRSASKQLPIGNDWEAVPDDEELTGTVQLAQVTGSGAVAVEDPVPIVDKPPRKLPDVPAQPLEPEEPPRKAERPGATKAVPVKAAPKVPVVDVAPSPMAAAPVAATPIAGGRSGPRMPLAPIDAIEDKTARARPLMDRALIDKTIEQGDLPTALRELSRWYWRNPGQREALHPELELLAKQVYFSPRPHFHEPYVIQPGDRLQNVARKYNVPWEYLCRANNINARKIRAGQKLKVIDGPFSAFVSLRNYELIIHHRGAFVRWYRVGTGKGGSSPIGTFSVKEKLMDPTYYGDEGVIAHDDPKNPLGERWIDIGDSFGIHGTIEPNSIGKSESRGCIRLLNADVEEVYDLLSVGSQVTIAP